MRSPFQDNEGSRSPILSSSECYAYLFAGQLARPNSTESFVGGLNKRTKISPLQPIYLDGKEVKLGSFRGPRLNAGVSKGAYEASEQHKTSSEAHKNGVIDACLNFLPYSRAEMLQ